MDRRVIVVSGGGTGIGKATAARFARDGEAVVIVGRRAAVLERAAEDIRETTANAAVLWRPCDVTDTASIGSLAGWISTSVGPNVDVLVNNAGIRADSPDPAAALDSVRDDANAVLAVNLVGAYLLTHALLPVVSRPGGRIIYVSSVAAYRGGKEMYAASNAGLVGLAYSQARNLGPAGITVNVVAPGFIPQTEMFANRLSPDRIVSESGASCVKRVGETDEVAYAIHYLASREAGYVTGEVHHVNGGTIFGR